MIDEFLGFLKGSERSRLLMELQRIERIYRVRLSFGQAATIAIPDEPLDRSARPAETFSMFSDAADDPAKFRPESQTPPDSQHDDPPPAQDSTASPDPSLATLKLPGNFATPSLDLTNQQAATSLSGSNLVPLLDSWGRDIEVPPIPGTLRSVVGPQPFVKGYEILGELGRGGMGVVYKANQQGLNRLVAIKMVLGGDHARAEDLVRFKIEAEAVASIQHPNIVQIYEVGDKDGTPYFSLEYIDGGTLHQRIDGKPQAPTEAASIAQQLALAMEHFHQRGVIHRDLKPANVLMTLQGSPKITDFGLAKRLEGNSSQTRTGSLMGTPSYMAPEQARGDTRAIGPLSDLYSLGAVLYEMLTGRPPFQGATMLDTIDQVRSQEPVPPRRLQPKIPRDLETICLKCLQKEPSKRYPGATELVADLRNFLDGEPIKARPISRAEMGWRWARRNPRIAILSSSILLLGLMLVVLAFFNASRTAREFQTIEEARRTARNRLNDGTRAIKSGDVRRAIEILGEPDPFVERTPALVEIRDDLRKLRAQVKTFADFERLLDLACYDGFVGSKQKRARGQNHFREVVTFYDEIESQQKRGGFGLPPLDPWTLQLFKEDVFDTFIVAAQVEIADQEQTEDPEVRKNAARLASEWLGRAEKLLPPTRVLFNRKRGIKKLLDDPAGSEADRKMAESIEPNSPVDLFWNAYSDVMRAEVAVREKNPAKVVEFYEMARDKFARHRLARPKHFWGHLEFANCHYGLSHGYDALAAYTECIELRPDAPWPYHNRAKALAMIKANDLAVIDENEAIKRDPLYFDAYQSLFSLHKVIGKPKEALEDVNAIIALATSSGDLNEKKAFTFQRGLLYYDLKEYDKALLDFDATVRDFPKQVLPYQNRVWTRFFLYDYEGALSDWLNIAALMPDNPEAHYYIGIFQMGFRRYDEALRAFDECLALDPNYALATLAKARIEYWKGNGTAAFDLIDRVVNKLESSNGTNATKADYLNERVDINRNLGRLDESERDARRSIELVPNQIDAYLALAMLEKKRGKTAAEIQVWYDAMLKANPDSPEAHLHRAGFFRSLGRWAEALAEVDRARSLPGDGVRESCDLVRAGISAAQGNFDSATTEADAILAKIRRPNGKILAEAAGVWSLAAGSAARSGDQTRSKILADRAAQLLKVALSETFHDLNYQAEERLVNDPALDQIKDRADVRRTLSFLP